MRFQDFKAVGYRGFGAYLGLKEIYIDFSKCKNNIVAIKGPNGCGKSTLINILHIFADSNDKFIPGEYGEKSGHIIDGSNKYYFMIKHPINDKGVRQQTKAYMYKYINDKKVDMNPNGNISSYTEYIFNEFAIDPSFLVLTSLSISNKGIVDKTPSDRKRYVNIIIRAVEAYNSFLKTLNKRRSGIKSIISNIVSKINMIGDEKEIELTLESITNRLNNLMNDKDIKLQQLAESKSKIKLLDPDGSIQETYKTIYENLTNVNNDISMNNSVIQKQLSKINIDISKENIQSIIDDIKMRISEYKFSISNNESIIKDTLDSREKESKELSEKSAKLDSMRLNLNENNIEKEIEDCKSLIDEYKYIVDKIGIIDIFSISKEEFVIGLQSLYDIKENILIARQHLSPYIIEQSSKYILNKIDEPDIDSMNMKLNKLRTDEVLMKTELEKYIGLLKETKKLEGRDKDCKINTCSFITGALEALKQNPEKNIKELDKCILHNIEKSEKLSKEIEVSKEIISGIQYLRSVCKQSKSNLSILRKLPLDMKIFGSDLYILNSIINGYKFEEIDYLYQYLEYANIIEEYKIQINRMKLLDKDYQIYIEKNKIVEEIINDIQSINKRIYDSTDKIEKLNADMILLSGDISKSELVLSYIEVLKELYEKDNILLNNKNIIINQYDIIKFNMNEIKNSIDNINKLNSDVSVLENQIKPLFNDRDKLNHQLSKTREYKIELEEFNRKIIKIETLRKYCNPNEDEAVQLLFIELYFFKTIQLANELLQLVFNGRYQLQKPNINGDEFTIPVVGNILPCDDISSLSESQRSLVGVILSFVLLFQSSTNYNIVRLDEVDESLDTENRLSFGILLDDLIRRLGFEQLFYVSHNSEVVLENADIILLTDLPEFKEQFKNHNIIFELKDAA